MIAERGPGGFGELGGGIDVVCDDWQGRGEVDALSDCRGGGELVAIVGELAAGGAQLRRGRPESWVEAYALGHQVTPAASQAHPGLAGGAEAALEACGVDAGLVEVAGLGGSADEHEGGAEEHAFGAGGQDEVPGAGRVDEGAVGLDVEPGQRLAQTRETDNRRGLLVGKCLGVVAWLEVVAEDAFGDTEPVGPAHSGADLVPPSVR